MSDDKDDLGTDLKREKKDGEKQHPRSEQKDERRRALPSTMHQNVPLRRMILVMQ